MNIKKVSTLMFIAGLSFLFTAVSCGSSQDSLDVENILANQNLNTCDPNRIYAKCEDEPEAPVCALIQENGTVVWRQWKNECQACALNESNFNKLSPKQLYIHGSKTESVILRNYKNMHDIHTANLVLQLAKEEAKKNQLEQISKIVIELGNIYEHGSFVNASNLKFNLKLLAKDFFSKNIVFEIHKNKKSNQVKLLYLEGN